MQSPNQELNFANAQATQAFEISLPMNSKEQKNTQESPLQKISNSVEEEKNSSLSSLQKFSQMQTFDQEPDLCSTIQGVKSKNALYKEKSRKKQQNIKKGTYQPSLLELAKNELQQLENPKLSTVMEQERFKNEFSQEDTKKLKIFAKNLRYRIKNQQNQSPHKEQNATSLIQSNRNLQISEELCAAPSQEAKMAVLRTHNNSNPISFFQYLTSLNSHPTSQFLPILVELIQENQHPLQKLRIFLGVCGLYKNERLNAEQLLCVEMLEYITNQESVTDRQALGFLRLLFTNNIGLQHCNINVLQDFDRRYSHIFPPFYGFLQSDPWNVSEEVIGVLPSTVMLMQRPLIKALKQASNAFAFVPAQYLKTTIELIVFTFCENNKALKELLNILQNGFIDTMEKLKKTKFLVFLQMLVDHLRSQDNHWFKKLSEINELLKGIFLMVGEDKIKVFDFTISSALLQQQSNPSDFLNQPSVVIQTTSNNESLLQEVVELNAHNELIQKDLMKLQPLSSQMIKIFFALKIEPHYLQTLCLTIFEQWDHYKSKFCVLGTGLGKTSVILARAAYLAMKSQQLIVVVNSDKRLLTRDFNLAVASIQTLGLQIDFQTFSRQTNVVFFQDTELRKMGSFPVKFHVLIDEFQSVLFDDATCFDLLPLFANAESIVGLTGSPLNEDQIIFLQRAFIQTLFMKFSKVYAFDDEKACVYRLQTEQFNHISKVITEHHSLSPIILILDSSAGRTFARQFKKDLYIVNLMEMDANMIDATLKQQFTQQTEKGIFGVYIIDENMATGTHFNSNSTIEQNGGICLVIGVLPKTISAFVQLNGRTCRIFKKGQRFYVFKDSQYFHYGPSYLKTMLTAMKQNENLSAKMLMQKFQQLNSNQGFAIEMVNEKICINATQQLPMIQHSEICSTYSYTNKLKNQSENGLDPSLFDVSSDPHLKFQQKSSELMQFDNLLMKNSPRYLGLDSRFLTSVQRSRSASFQSAYNKTLLHQNDDSMEEPKIQNADVLGKRKAEDDIENLQQCINNDNSNV